ncbi:MAG: hypothetical protein HQL48_05160 [Gammaproteobacteria bacterium]|nr:hypothetical protein [Gammaproteobacteria bacterium]
MNRGSNLLLIVSFVITMFIFPLSGVSGDLDLTDLQNAKVARKKAIQNRVKSESTENSSGVGSMEEEDCGNVEIGNIQAGNKIGQMPRSVDVIITGDVINTGKCK